jgi:hypothetical protein
MGQECVQISIWQLQLQFDFSDGSSIIVESKWELWNGCNVMDQFMSHAQRETYCVHKLIGQKVCGFLLTPLFLLL